METHNQLIQQAVAEHHGHIIKTIGDAFLVDFPSVVNAVQCAQVIQAQLHAHNAEKDKTEQIHVRIEIPKFSLETVKRWMPYQGPAALECQLAALRKAGLK